MCGDDFGGLNFDAMDWASRGFGVGVGAGISAAAACAGRACAGVVVFTRVTARNFCGVFKGLERRFGFARSFERVAHNRIHVVTTANVGHVFLRCVK
jgi:hypothetical protein